MLFPDGTQTGGDPPTRALPDIWTNMETFQGLAAELSSQAANAANVAASGDLEAFRAVYAEARAVCDTCHESFRGPAPQ
jgi:cytochrome c556